jgi:predicted metal-dependent hydrolase
LGRGAVLAASRRSTSVPHAPFVSPGRKSNYEQIQIRNQKTCWGSYSQRTGTLSLNFRLLMAPPDIVDYVMVHELAHAEHPNHGARFWRLVEQHVPDYEEKDEWLKENGTRLLFDGSSV